MQDTAANSMEHHSPPGLDPKEPRMKCQHCGATLKPDSRFCGSCGKPAGSGIALPSATATTPVAKKRAAVKQTAAISATDAAPEATPPAVPAPVPLVAPWARKRKIIVAGVAAASVLLVAAAAVGIGFAVSRAATPTIVADQTDASSEDESSSSGDDSESEDQQVDEPTSAPDPVVVPPVEFASTSGNIRCHVDSDGVVCRQGEVKYAVPSQNCSSLSGTTIGLSADGVWWPCLTSDFVPSQKLAYDTPLAAFGYSCSINYSTGITCTNASGNGFQMEYYAGVSTF